MGDYRGPWIGKPSQVKEWDYTTGSFGSTPARETVYTYGYTVNGAALLTQENTYSNGTALGQVVLNYDQTTPTPTSGLPQHVSVSGPRGDLTSIANGLSGGPQTTVTFAYDDAGMLLSTVDANGNSTSFSYMCDDAYPAKTTYPTVNSVAHVTKSTEDCSSGALLNTTDENSNVTTYAYDGIGRLSSITYPDTGKTSYSYPSPSEFVVSKLINASLSGTTTTTLDSLGRIFEVSQSDPAGDDVTKYEYDNNGRIEWVYNPERSGITSSTDGYTSYYYDFLDRPMEIVEPDNQTINISYSGNQSTVTDEDGNKRKYQYDAFHDLTATWEPDSSGVLNWETTYGYDGAGRLTSVNQYGSNSSTPHTRTFAYDSLGRMTSETTPEAGQTSFTYDGNGNTITITDQRQITTTNTYDALNRLTHVSYSDGTASDFYSYDVSPSWAGGLTNVIGRIANSGNAYNGGTSGKATATLFSYDSMGRVLLRWDQTPSTSPGGFSIHATYDLAGDLHSLTYPDGRTLTYSYDSADHLTGVQYTGWNGTSENASYFSNPSFDPPGQMTAATFGNGVAMAAGFTSRQTLSALSYAKGGQPIWSKQYTWASNGENLLQIADEINSAQTYNFAYDPDNRIKSASGGGDVVISPATAGHGSVNIGGSEKSTSIRVVCGPGPTYCNETIWDNGTVTVTIDGVNFSTSYGQSSTGISLASALTSQINANSTVVTASNSGTSTITIVAKTTGASTNYSLSASSSTQNTTYFSSPSFTPQASGATLTGGANAVTSGADVLSETYSIDAWGNLQKSGNFNFDQPYGSNNQIQASGYGYDAAGNLTSDALSNTYQYDAAERLIASDGANYIYDEYGDRVRKNNGSNATEYIYFNGEPIALYNPSNGSVTDLVWDASNLFAEVAGNQTATPDYRLTDHLGSLAMLTDGSGNVLGSNVFSPYGDIMSSSTNDLYGYTGLEEDNENGSDHAMARNLALAQGRWLSPDPYMGSYDLMNPQSFNRYSYVGNMPMQFVDPSGQDPSGLLGCAGGPVGSVVGIVGSAILDKYLLSFLFGGPSFHGSLTPRPGVRGGVWNDTFGVPYQSPLTPGGLDQVLDIPGGTGGCDFGACDGGPEFLGPSDTGALNPQNKFQYTVGSIAELFGFGVAYANWGDPNERLFGTHYCGPGGGGTETDALDHYCHIHDLCYNALGVSGDVNVREALKNGEL